MQSHWSAFNGNHYMANQLTNSIASTYPSGMTPMTSTFHSTGYADWLQQLKSDILRAQQRAALAVNAELIQLYLWIRRDILTRQESPAWGTKVINRVAQDLKDAFPEMRGGPSRNLKYMRFFSQHCPDGLIGQQAAAQLPWFHIVTLLTKLDNTTERE
jgi:predicted nuclease of restriction endonuclease-like (RecB) superfamily